ncbi:MAG: hypothetical protein ACI9WT_001045, partial [Flavobacterium sp.]
FLYLNMFSKIKMTKIKYENRSFFHLLGKGDCL